MNCSDQPRYFVTPKSAIGLLACILVGACTVSPTDTRQALEEQGYSDVQLGGNSWFGCDSKDGFTRVWTATATNGARVKGVACGGWFKGVTIRRTKRLAGA